MLKTGNYTEDGAGNPTAGAQLSAVSTALKVASGSFQVGTVMFSDYWFRLLQGIDGSIAAGRVIWRGNNDSSTRGGAPNIACLSIYPQGSQNVQSNFQQVYYSYTVTPTSYNSYTDNLDAMQQIHLQFYRATTDSAPFSEFFSPCPSRTYDGASGAVRGSFHWGWRYGGSGAVTSGPLDGPNGVSSVLIRARLANSYGWSATRDYAGGQGVNVALGSTTITGSASSGGGGSGGSGGGGGGYCPAPWVKVRLVNGTEVNAGSLHNGACVAAVDDNTMTALPNGGIVRDFAVIWALRYQVRLTDGEATEWSHNHRFATVKRGWVHVQDLMPGDHIMGIKECIVDTVLATGEGQVVSFRVEGAGTYFAGGMLCHNIKAPQEL
ncbi:MAG: hypothetical protein EOO80_12625 [Oxalobacteraceae bacterium]|nr:MAG: hypothetical protein EOO80_12625 [Oxalobacteraceae bacterium]